MKFNLLGFRFNIGRNRPRIIRHITAKYDAAKTNAMNQRHWLNADALSADEANSPHVRRTLRVRSRYERANNSYFESMVETMGDSVVGSGPRLLFMDEDTAINVIMEDLFNQWFIGMEGPDKLWTGYNASVGDGEAFFIESNRFNPRSRVQLNYKLWEAERCTNGFDTNTKNNIDGVLLDDDGNVTGYMFSVEHPGDNFGFAGRFVGEFITKRADQVIHFYKKARPEQHRGIPEITSSLPVGSKQRGFGLATLEAAKNAAQYTGVLRTTGDPYPDENTETGEQGPDGFEALDPIRLENGMLLTLPKNWDMTQVKAEHPNTNYSDFKKENISEMGRSLRMPYNVAAGTSEGFNFASGRLDRLSFNKSIDIRQSQVSNRIMWPMFQKWFDEALRIPGFLPPKVSQPGYVPRFDWLYDGDSTIDPQKEAKADDTNLKNGSDNYTNIYAKKGLDVRVEFKKIQQEMELAKQLGIESRLKEMSQAPEEAPDAEAVAEAMVEEGITV